ncbi:unnamed protein product [Fusarium langsethiae]|nr:unnamed protein product [Fusarium langsethiae]
MAPGGPPGADSRGRGGKFRKPARGGGKKFSRDIRPLDADGNEVSMWAVDHDKEDGDEEDSSEEESEEEEDSDDAADAGPAKELTQEQSRELRKAEKKARKEAAIARSKAKTVEVGDLPSSDSDESDSDSDDDMPANPNHSKKARKQATVGIDGITEDMENLQAAPTRREREALEAAAAKEKHMRLTAQGKTDVSKADLERLAAIREQRALDAARRQAEREEREEQEKIKKAEFEAREARKREAALGKKGKKK